MARISIQEVILLLAGQPSSFFVVVQDPHLPGPSIPTTLQECPWSWTLRLTDACTLSHKGDRDILNALADAASMYRRIKLFAHSIKSRASTQVLQAFKQRQKGNDWQNIALSSIAASLLNILKSYELLIQEVERDINIGTWDSTLYVEESDNDALAVSLVNLRARVEPWKASLTALNNLVSALLQGPHSSVAPSAPVMDASRAGDTDFDPASPPRCPQWCTGQLLDMLSMQRETAVGLVRENMEVVLRSVEDVWRSTSLLAWMCEGKSRVDPSSVFGSTEEPIVEWVGKDRLANERSLSSDSSSESANPLPKLAVWQPSEDDASMTARWRFVPNALPRWIVDDTSTSNAILYIGRALARMRAQASALSTTSMQNRQKIPEKLCRAHAALLLSNDARPCSNQIGFKKAVEAIRDNVGEYLWRNVLTPVAVMDVFESLSSIFLHRNGLFSTSFLNRLTELRRSKLLRARSAGVNVIRAPDIELAIQRATIDAGIEDESLLERCSVSLPKLPRRTDADWKNTPDDFIVRFDDFSLGIPFTLCYQPKFPLDFLLTPNETRAYANLFSYFLALAQARARLRDAYQNISKAQRDRRRFTGTGEGGDDRREVRKRKELHRLSCGTLREGLWFLDTLCGHFQTDVVDAHHTGFAEQLQRLRATSTSKLRHHQLEEQVLQQQQQQKAHADVNVDRWRQRVGKHVRRSSSMQTLREDESLTGEKPTVTVSRARSTYAAESLARRIGRASVASKSVFDGASQHDGVSRVGSKQSNTVREAVPAAAAPSHTAAQNAQEVLGFSTLRSAHQSFLSHILEGVLLTSLAACQCIWRILQTLNRLTGMIERWGGDVLPDLLSEGSIVDSGGPALLPSHDQDASVSGQTVLEKRHAIIQEITNVLQMHTETFFHIVTDRSHGAGRSGQKKKGDITKVEKSEVDAQQALADQFKGGVQKDHGDTVDVMPPQVPVLSDAESAAIRHHEQLLLRLDFSRHFSRTFAARQQAGEVLDVSL